MAVCSERRSDGASEFLQRVLMQTHCANRAPCLAETDGNYKNQDWLITRGESQLLRLHGTDFCADAGESPANGYKLTMQKWWVPEPTLLVAFCLSTFPL